MAGLYELDDKQVTVLVNALSFYTDAILNLSAAITIKTTDEYMTAMHLWKRFLLSSNSGGSECEI